MAADLASRGTVIWYDPCKGYGMAERKGGTRVFVHCSALPRLEDVLQPGQEIEFVVEQTVRGEIAKQVRPL